MNSSLRVSEVDTNLYPLTSVVETSPFPMVLIKSDGSIVMANWSAESLFCYEPQQLIGQAIETLFHHLPDVDQHQYCPSRFIQLWRGSLEKKQELSALRKDGNRFPVEVSLHPRQTAVGLYLLVTIIDTTEQMWAKTEFDRLSRHQQYILNSAGEGIYGLNRNGQLTFINPAAARMVGWEIAEILGKTQHTVFDHGRPDGSLHCSGECHIFSTFLNNTVHHVDNEVFWRKDGTSFPVEYTSTPLHDEKGETIGVVVTFRDITQRKQIEETDHALRVMKDEFIVTASHELKTPIASLRGFMKLLLDGKVKDPVIQKEFLTRASQDVDRLLALVADLLDTSKLEIGLSQFSPEEVELEVVIQDTFESFTRLAQDKSIRLQYELLSESIMIMVDRQAFQRVLRNLVGNAIKFSEPQQPIVVTGESTANGVIINVIDQGPGLPQNEASRLFEKFYQAKSTTRSADGGTGLGLFIAKQIIEGHGGEIVVASEVGQGSTFTISLPLPSRADNIE